MSKNQSVKVGIRIRPLNKRQLELNSPICVQNRDNILGIKKEKDTKEFVFDYVFGIDTRQEGIYENCAFNLVQNALDGYNGTIFAYGQTGAGKTFTMVGDYKDPQIKGIIPRTFDHVIAAIHTSEDRQYVVRASFIQIYNEDIMDLLEEKRASAKKDLKQNPGKGVFIKDLKMVAVKSVDEMFKILDIGNKNRSVQATKMNATSSRSHALFTVHVQSLEGKDKVKGSKINLVDLAGSERQSKTQATGDRLKQGAKINLSLTALGNVINALVDGKKGGHIPYRDSKLTRLLQDSLGGNTKTLMIASVSPAADNYDETISTLRYAARARNIKNTPKVNEDPKDAMIRQYLQEIEKLKKQLGSGGGGEFMMNEQMSQGHEELKKEAEKAKEVAEKRQRQLNEKEDEISMMKEKLKEMEGLVLKKEEVSPQIMKTRKLKKKKAQKQQELIQKKLEDFEKENDELLDENVEEKSEKGQGYWKNLASKLRKKLKSAISEQKDLQKQFETEREDLNKTIRDLEGDLSFYRQLSQKFISDSEIAVIKENAEYDEERREYTLPPFLMHEGEVSLPKSLKRYEVEDLWQEKRKNNKIQLLGSDLPSVQKQEKKQAKFASYQEPKGSPFRQTKRLFNLSDYTNIKYEQKEVEQREQQMFRRTRFNINERTNSRSRSRSNSNAKLQPLKHSDKSLEPLRPVSKGKERLAPIRKI